MAQSIKTQPTMIRHSNLDFQINPDWDPDISQITAKTLWIHYLVSVSHFATCRENQPVTVTNKSLKIPYSTMAREVEKWSVSGAGWSLPQVNQFFRFIFHRHNHNIKLQWNWLIAQTMPWQDVCPSICPSHAGIVSKRLHISSKFIHRRVAPTF